MADFENPRNSSKMLKITLLHSKEKLPTPANVVF